MKNNPAGPLLRVLPFSGGMHMCFKRLGCMALCALLLLGLLPLSGFAETSFSWSLEGGTLTVSGTGDMDFGEIPWADRLEEIRSVRMDEGITSLQEGAFAGCGSLRSVTLPKSLRYVGKDAFRDCGALSWISLPSGLIGIEEGAFSGCAKLRSVFVPQSVSWIADRAFEGDVLLNGRRESAAEDYIRDNGGSFRPSNHQEYPPASGNWGSIQWTLEKGKLTLSGTGAVGGNAMADFPWETHRAEISALEVGEGITSLDPLAFAYCRKLTQVSLPASLTTLAEGTFRQDAVITGLPEEPDNAPEAAEPTEEVAAPEAAEPTEETAAPEATEPTEETAAPEATEPTEETAAPEETEPTEETAAPEETEPTAETAIPEEGEILTLTVGSLAAQPGQTIALPITLSGNPGLCGLNFALAYDKTALTLTDYDCLGQLLSVSDWTVGVGAGEKALWLQSDPTEGNGEVLTLVFQVADQAPQGELTVTLEEVLAVEEGGSSPQVRVCPGIVTITSGMAGDVNGDGRVTFADAQRLRRFLSGQEVAIQNGSADLNGDGLVNLLDLQLLQRVVSKE